jgi:hypothetical protein
VKIGLLLLWRVHKCAGAIATVVSRQSRRVFRTYAAVQHSLAVDNTRVRGHDSTSSLRTMANVVSLTVDPRNDVGVFEAHEKQRRLLRCEPVLYFIQRHIFGLVTAPSHHNMAPSKFPLVVRVVVRNQITICHSTVRRVSVACDCVLDRRIFRTAYYLNIPIKGTDLCFLRFSLTGFELDVS